MIDYTIKATYTCVKDFGNGKVVKDTYTSVMSSKHEFLVRAEQLGEIRKRLGYEISTSNNKEEWTFHTKNRLLEITSVFSMRRLTAEERNKLINGKQ